MNKYIEEVMDDMKELANELIDQSSSFKLNNNILYVSFVIEDKASEIIRKIRKYESVYIKEYTPNLRLDQIDYKLVDEYKFITKLLDKIKESLYGGSNIIGLSLDEDATYIFSLETKQYKEEYTLISDIIDKLNEDDLQVIKMMQELIFDYKVKIAIDNQELLYILPNKLYSRSLYDTALSIEFENDSILLSFLREK